MHLMFEICKTGYSKYKTCVTCMHGSDLTEFGCVSFENKISECSFNLSRLNTHNGEDVAVKSYAMNNTATSNTKTEVEARSVPL